MATNDDREIDELLQDLFARKEGLKELLEAVLNTVMKAEVDQHVCAKPYERTTRRRGMRNGTKHRSLKTRVGQLDLEVPQVRGCEPYHPSMFARWQRSERAMLTACAQMYFQGVSTRRVQEVLKEMGGLGISAGQVSRIAAELGEQLSVFRNRRLDYTQYCFLVIDARYEKVRRNGHIVTQAVLITAGITWEGRREILDWRIGDSESEETWSDVFKGLKDRGLKGLMMVTSLSAEGSPKAGDAHKGIKAALARHFQGVAWQRCRVHFKRELLRKTSYKHHKQLMSDIRSVFLPEERSECLKRAEEMAARWERVAPKVARMLRDDFESCLTVCRLPPQHRRRLGSTNMLERVMRELKRRSRVVGIFPDRSSCDRLIGARLMELHETWQLEERRYLPMDALERPEYQGVLQFANTG